MRRTLAAVAAWLIGASGGFACAGTDGICDIGSGSYHLRLPDGATTPPAVMFLHGYGGMGAGTIRNAALVEPLLARGCAVIAPNALPMKGRRGGRWAFYPGRPKARDELAFLQEVRADAAARHGIDPDRVLLAGFSNGGFLVTYIACDAPDSFTAFAPVAGAFWRPHPDACTPGPVRLFHTHGWRDRTVPLEGRPLGGGRFVQGDVFRTLEIFRAANGCAYDTPDTTDATGDFLRRRWTQCAPGGDLELALFDGGHGLPDGWPDMVTDWFESLD